MLSLYPALIEAVIEFKFFAEDYLKKEGQIFEIDKELPAHPAEFSLI